MPIIRAENTIWLGYYNKKSLARGSNGRLYAAYEYASPATGRQEVGVSQSTDGGMTWTVLFTIGGPLNHHYEYPSIAVDAADNLHIVYEHINLAAIDTAEYRVYSAGALGAAITIDALASYTPMVAIDSLDRVSIIYLRWGLFIRYQRYDNGVLVIDEDLPLSRWGNHPALAINSQNNIHAVYEHQPVAGNWDVYYNLRGSLGWGAQTQLTNDAYNESDPGIALDPLDQPHLVWRGTGGVTYQTQVGGIWQAPEVTAGYNAPAIAVNLSDIITITMHQAILPPHPGFYIEKNIGGVWGPPANFSGVGNTENGNIMWARWPEINGVKTNIPLSGCALCYRIMAAIDEVHYLGLNPLWPTPPPPPPYPSVVTLPATEVR